jgi:stringent starvation protein B
MASKLPKKKDVALALLEQASVFIHLDPRREGVLVPAGFKKQAQLVLQIGLNLLVKIPDLEVDDEGISCTLSFNRRPHYCHMPWPSVYALVDESGRGMVWPDDVPPEVVAQQRESAKKTPAPQQRPRLRAVDSGAEGSQPPSTPEASATPETKSAPAPAPAPTAELALAPESSSAPESSAPARDARTGEATLLRSEHPRSDNPRTKSGKMLAQTERKSSPPASKSTRPPYLRLVK